MMARKIRVVLLENVEGVGAANEVVTVAEGYARNFLFPSGKAALATGDTEAKAQQQQKQKQEKVQADLAELQQRAEELDGTELSMTAQRKEGEDIFGSISATAIAKELSQQTSQPFKAKDIKLSKPIKQFGSYPVTVRFSEDAEAELTVTIVPQENGHAEADKEEE